MFSFFSYTNANAEMNVIMNGVGQDLKTPPVQMSPGNQQ